MEKKENISEQLAKALEKAGADINALPLINGKTWLENAVYEENLGDVEFLLEKGADPNVRSYGRTLLHWSLGFEKPAIFTLLVKYGAKVDPPFKETLSPAMHKALIELGIPVNDDGTIKSLTEIFLETKDMSVIEKLAKIQSLDVDAKMGAWGKPLIQVVREKNDIAKLAFLVKNGAQLPEEGLSKQESKLVLMELAKGDVKSFATVFSKLLPNKNNLNPEALDFGKDVNPPVKAYLDLLRSIIAAKSGVLDASMFGKSGSKKSYLDGMKDVLLGIDRRSDFEKTWPEAPKAYAKIAAEFKKVCDSMAATEGSTNVAQITPN